MKRSLEELVDHLIETRGSTVQLQRTNVWQAIRGAIDGRLLIDNLAEALRISSPETEQLLADGGFGDVVAQLKIRSTVHSSDAGPLRDFAIVESRHFVFPFDDYFSVDCSPSLDQTVNLSPEQHDAMNLLLEGILDSSATDPFISLYRTDVMEYHDTFVAREGSRIQEFLECHFGPKAERLQYLITSGIGANEQFNHFPAAINNSDPHRRLTWFIINSTRQLRRLPADVDLSNTLFMEFSRSGKTEETVKIHEFTPAKAARVVFANSGPLKELGERDADCNLTLELPDEVSGRFGRNKTPILLAPMFVAGMDTRHYWQMIERAINEMDQWSSSNLALCLAQYIYIYQLRNDINGIYLGCNDDLLAASADEFLQFWNEGVNKDGNDIMMARHFGLLRDSHATVEGILGNAGRKLSLFLLSSESRTNNLPPLACPKINPINPDHLGLLFGDEEVALAAANYEHMSRVMPCIKIQLKNEPDLDHSAILGQLWSDITYFYSRLKGVDPGSNPEVKHVRDRGAAELSMAAQRRRENES
jgi:hypothetical protein